MFYLAENQQNLGGKQESLPVRMLVREPCETARTHVFSKTDKGVGVCLKDFRSQRTELKDCQFYILSLS